MIRRVLRAGRRALRKTGRKTRRWVRALIGKPAQRAVRRSRIEGSIADAVDAVRPGPSRIRALRRYEISDLTSTIKYYKNRAEYLGVAAGIADGLIRDRHLKTALELGPHLRPLIVGADTMELHAHPDLQAEGTRIVHDATAAPWPVADKAYDLFVALQVFEHLGTKQPVAFAEVRRVARHAILSLPIDWDLKDKTNSHYMISHERVLSWFAPVAPSRVVVGNGGSGKRLIYVFEDLPGPD